MRNFFATLLLSQGTPMIVAGDEFARTQHGNNNAYCQDSEIGWVNWDLSEDGKALLKFVKRLIKLRLAYPILRRGRFLVGDYNEDIGVKDVTWLAADGSEMTTEHWHDPHNRCLGMLLDGRAQETGIRRQGPTPPCCWWSTPITTSSISPCRKCPMAASGPVWSIPINRRFAARSASSSATSIQ
jgi:glycogen operon protein